MHHFGKVVMFKCAILKPFRLYSSFSFEGFSFNIRSLVYSRVLKGVKKFLRKLFDDVTPYTQSLQQDYVPHPQKQMHDFLLPLQKRHKLFCNENHCCKRKPSSFMITNKNLLIRNSKNILHIHAELVLSQ